MGTSSISSKGQVTIPVELRNLLELKPGDSVEFFHEDGRVFLRRKRSDITDSFGMFAPNKSVSLSDMEDAIAKGISDESD